MINWGLTPRTPLSFAPRCQVRSRIWYSNITYRFFSLHRLTSDNYTVDSEIVIESI